MSLEKLKFVMIGLMLLAPAAVMAQIPDEVPDAPEAPETPATPAGPTLPVGAVFFFDGAECPAGFEEMTAAHGRAIVATGASGTVGGTSGDALGDLEARSHNHGGETDTSSDSHNHLTFRFTTAEAWYDGTGNQLINWNNGLDSGGSGIYPIAVDFRNRNAAYYTDTDTHDHTVDIASDVGTLPYIQLLACKVMAAPEAPEAPPAPPVPEEAPEAPDVPDVPASNPALVEELQANVESLEAENEALEARIAALEEMVLNMAAPSVPEVTEDVSSAAPVEVSLI